MIIKINEKNYLKVWLKLMLLKTHIEVSPKELDVFQYVCKLQPVSTEERRIIARELSTSYQVVSNTLKCLKDKQLIKLHRDGKKKYNGRKYYYTSNILHPSSIDKLLNWKDSITFDKN